MKKLQFGPYKVPDLVFHREIKPRILKNANPSKYSWKVGDNPDIKVTGGKVVLVGSSQGPFKGKSYDTGLDAKTFFNGY